MSQARGRRPAVMIALLILAIVGVGGALAYPRLKPKLPLFGGFTGDMPFSWRLQDSNRADPAKAKLNGQLTVYMADNASVLAYQGVKSTFPRNLTGTSVSIEADMSQASTADTIEAKFRMTLDHYDDFVSIQAEGPELNTVQMVRHVASEVRFPYDRVRERFWRLAHDPRTDEIVWSVSPDGKDWRELRRQRRQVRLDKAKIEIYAGTFKPTARPGQVRFAGCC